VRLLCASPRRYCTYCDEDVARSVALKVGDRELFGTVIQVVEKLLRVGFFDGGMYREHGILTSRGIQKRYERACADSGRKINRVPERYRLLQSEPALPEEESVVLEEEIPLENYWEDGGTGLPAENPGLPGRKPVFAAQETPQRKEKKTIEFDVDDVREYARARARRRISPASKATTTPRREYARARARGVGREWQAVFGRAPTPAQLEVLERWAGEYGGAGGMEPDVFREAMRRAATAGAGHPIAYVGALLADWRRQRLRTLDDVDAAQYRFDHAAGKV
jgi:DnaD/phage-associated family protein